MPLKQLLLNSPDCSHKGSYLLTFRSYTYTCNKGNSMLQPVGKLKTKGSTDEKGEV